MEQPSDYYAGYDEYTCIRDGRCGYSYKSYENSYSKEYEPLLLKDWEYTVHDDIENKIINLDKYRGTSSTVKIPGVVFIAGKTYQVTVGYKSKLDVSDVFACNQNIESIKSMDLKIYDGKALFKGLSNLTNVRLTNIAVDTDANLESLFENCTSLEDIDLSECQISKSSSLYKAFQGCTNLKTVKLFANVGDDYYVSKAKKISLGYTFRYCANLTSVNFGDIKINDTSLGGTFINCSSLQYLELSAFNGDTTTFMGTFENCSSLQTVYLLNSKPVSTVKCDNMFKGCASLKKVGTNTTTYNLLNNNKDVLGVNFSLIQNCN